MSAVHIAQNAGLSDQKIILSYSCASRGAASWSFVIIGYLSCLEWQHTRLLNRVASGAIEVAIAMVLACTGAIVVVIYLGKVSARSLIAKPASAFSDPALPATLKQ